MVMVVDTDKELFKSKDEINGLVVPDRACVFGSDFECFDSLGSDLFFSNYWVGTPESAAKFAEDLAEYFKEQYGQLEADPDNYDFQGLVMLWLVDDETALVGSVNLFDDFSFWPLDDATPDELRGSVHANGMVRIMDDGNDNCVVDLLYDEDVPEALKRKLFRVVAEVSKDDYLSVAKENGVDLG